MSMNRLRQIPRTLDVVVQREDSGYSPEVDGGLYAKETRGVFALLPAAPSDDGRRSLRI